MMLNKNIKNTFWLILILFTIMNQNACAQKDTLKAFWVDVITNNKVLIEYSKQLENLEKGNPANSLKAFTLFKEIAANNSESVVDTAMLICIYYQRSFDYFEGNNNKAYESFYDDESYVPNDSLLSIVNKQELENYGFKLIKFTHGGIITAPIPGFIEKKLKDSVGNELKDFLHWYTEKQKLTDILITESHYYKFIHGLENHILLEEEYISKNKFLIDYFKQSYYNTLINFTLGMVNALGEYNDKYDGSPILDTNLTFIFNNFINEYPKSKTTWFIRTLRSVDEDFDKDISNQLFHELIEFKCINENGYLCKKEWFNYDDFEKNVNEIIKCFKEGNCH